MERLGTVVRTANRLAIARLPGDEHPRIGTEAVDEQLSSIGRVVDVFGPVERPYVAIKADDDSNLPSLLGSKVYAR